jgi:hypothetical protein
MAITSTSGVDTTALLPSTTSTGTDANLPATAGATAAAGTGTDKLSDAEKANQLTTAGAKQQLNIAILQSSLEVSISSQNDPLALVYKSAIENLNEVLKPQLGDNAIQNAASEDNSPEATAGRIVSFVTNMFEMYKQNNPDKDDSGNVNSYMGLIYSGVEKGFKEARDILSSLNVLNGTLSDNIDKTYDLVQKGLADFMAKIKNPDQGQTDGGTPSDGTVTASETTVTVSVSVSQTRISTSA